MPAVLAVAEAVDDFSGAVVRGDLAGVTVVPLAVAVQAAALTLGLARMPYTDVCVGFGMAFDFPDERHDTAAVWFRGKRRERSVRIALDMVGVHVVMDDRGVAITHVVAETTDDPGFVECRTADEARRTSGRCTLAVAIEAAAMFRECGHPATAR